CALTGPERRERCVLGPRVAANQPYTTEMDKLVIGRQRARLPVSGLLHVGPVVFQPHVAHFQFPCLAAHGNSEPVSCGGSRSSRTRIGGNSARLPLDGSHLLGSSFQGGG